MCQFLESICAINGNILNLEYHQKRINRTFREYFKNSSPINLKEILKNKDIPIKKTKVRILYSKNEYKLTMQEYFEKKIERVKIVTDNNIDYSFKSANRDKINKHIDNNKDFDDIIIVKNNLVTDSSYANLIFYDGISWATPKNPLLKGTKREELLLNNKIKEKIITLNDLPSYLFFMPINALLDFDEERKININKIITI